MTEGESGRITEVPLVVHVAPAPRSRRRDVSHPDRRGDLDLVPRGMGSFPG